MTAVAKWYGGAFLKAFNKEIAWSTDTIKVMLCTSSYVPNRDTHVYKSDVTNEVTAAGSYSAGGATLTTKTITWDAVNHQMILDADDVSWAGGAPVARIAVIYDASPSTDATRPLLGYVDFGTDLAVLTIAWDPTGIFNDASL